MSTLLAAVLVLLVLALLGLTLWALVKAVAGDGLGHRPTPRSHRDELDPRPWAGMLPG